MARKEKAGGPGPDDGTAAMVLVAMRRIIRAIDLRSRYLVMHHGLTGPQLALLRELDAHDGCTVGEVSKALHLSQATVTGVLDRLAKRDLIQRQRSSEDRRRVQVWLTGAAREVLTDAPPLLQEEFTDEFGKLEDWEQTQILSALQRIVSMMEAKHIEATPMLTTGPVAATTDDTKAFLNQKAPGSNRPSGNRPDKTPEGTASER